MTITAHTTLPQPGNQQEAAKVSITAYVYTKNKSRGPLTLILEMRKLPKNHALVPLKDFGQGLVESSHRGQDPATGTMTVIVEDGVFDNVAQSLNA